MHHPSGLLPALELTTAATQVQDDPELYEEAFQRVLQEVVDDADPQRSVAELIFWLSALSAGFLDQLASMLHTDRSVVVASIMGAFPDPERED